MSDYDPSDPNTPIAWAHAANAYIPELWRRRDEEHWQMAATAMSSSWTPQPPPYHEEVLETSRRLIAEGDATKYQLAVVMAQVACEVLADQVVTSLIERVEPKRLRKWILKHGKLGDNFDDNRVRELYVALTGDEVDWGKGLWQQYRKHIERRNGVVHRGKRVSRAEATHSYETAREVIEYLRGVQERLTRAGDPG